MNFFWNFVGKFWLILHCWKCISRRKVHFASNRFRILTVLKNVAAAVALPDVCLPKQNCQFHSSKKNLVKIRQTGYKRKKSKRSLLINKDCSTCILVLLLFAFANIQIFWLWLVASIVFVTLLTLLNKVGRSLGPS